MATSDRALVLEWASRGAIPPERVGDALAAAGVTPTANDWHRFLNRLLLLSAAACLGVGIIFFLAANWDALGDYSKFGLIELAIVAAVAGACWFGVDRLEGQAALLVATLALGGLLALFGQTYQTGADPWQLFASWAALSLAWVIVARFAPLWLLWILLLDLAVGLYLNEAPIFRGMLRGSRLQVWILFAVNALAWAAWELASRRYAWLRPRWAVRILALLAGGLATAATIVAILDDDAQAWDMLALALWLATLFAVYRRRIPDLFMLAGGCLSIIATVTTALGELLVDRDTGTGFLVVAMAVIGMSTAAAMWLRSVAAEQGP